MIGLYNSADLLLLDVLGEEQTPEAVTPLDLKDAVPPSIGTQPFRLF
jgi:hypothetical protein